MGRKLAMRIMKPDKLREIATLLDIDLESLDTFKHPETLYVSNLTRSNLRGSLDEGDISERQYKTFLKLSIIISKYHWNTLKKVSIRQSCYL